MSPSPPADPDPTGAGPASGPAARPGACPPGSRHALLPGVRSRVVRTPRLATHVYESGTPGGEPIVLIHGNASSARFFEELMAALPGRYVVAPDLRGYGASESLVVDARRGVGDYADDVHALVETLGIGSFHLLGWSLGGCVAMRYVIDHPDRVRSLTLQAPGSPYGYGGTRGPDGRPNYDDFAGSGGGLISLEVRARYAQRDAGTDSPFSPRNGLRRLVVKPPFRFAPEREDALVEQMLLMVIGDQYYPGDATPSAHWPFAAPGVYGANNAQSPKYCDLSPLAALRGGPPILWVRGADDQVVQDGAMADPAQLGKLGIIPGWPGDEVCPPQPMVAQTRAVLERYAANSGTYREEVFADCGHSPHLEHPERFRALFADFVGATSGRPAAGASVATGSPAGVTRTDGGERPPAGELHAEVPPRHGGLLRRLFGRR